MKIFHYYKKYFIPEVPASEYDRLVADDDQHDCRGDLLRPDPRPRHLHHTESGLLQETVQGEGGRNYDKY